MNDFASHPMEQHGDWSHETALVRLVIPVPRSFLWLGGFLSVMLLGGLVTVGWLFSTATP
jgi:hypothetical protein